MRRAEPDGRRSITLDGHHARRYYRSMIKTFKCADTEALSKGRRVKRFVNIESVARRKRRQLQMSGRVLITVSRLTLITHDVTIGL